MPAPSSLVPRFDLSLRYAEVSALGVRRRYIGALVAPPVAVAQMYATFLRLPAEAWLRPVETTQRAPRASYRRSDYEWETDSYKCEDHGVEEVIDDNDIDTYGGILPAEFIAAERAATRLAQAFENDVAAAAQSATVFTGASLTTSVSTPWSTAASATPITNVDAAMKQVFTNVGSYPNAIALSAATALNYVRSAQVQDLVKYGGTDDPAALFPGFASIIKRLHPSIEHVFIGDGIKNTADLGSTSPTFTRFWDPSKATVFHWNDVQDLQQLTPCTFKTVMYSGNNAALPGGGEGEITFLMEQYREENVRSSVLRARNYRHVKTLHVESGHVLTNLGT